MEYSGSVAQSLLPTFENVTGEFIINTMYKLLYSKDIANFKMRFSEPEAMDFISKTLEKYANQSEFAKRKAKKILEGLEDNTSDNIPVMLINDYQDFFEQLRQFYEEHIRMFFKRTTFSSFHSYAMVNCFDLIWLRATPEDFNDPEEFLRKQVQMIKDNTFSKYDKETSLGKIECLDNNILCIQNKVARIWDETSQEMHISIYDKEYYDNTELFDRQHYTLPVIRYGIFEKDGKKVCRIGSIQNKEVGSKKSAVSKKVDRAKYKVNEGVTEQDMERVEPKSLIALSIFINLLNQEGITDIQVPSMYVLDYNYHEKMGEKLMREFKHRWGDKYISGDGSQRYMRERAHLERTYGKEDLISEIKTERFIKLFNRLLCHYPNASITSYPAEVDNNYHILIPKIKHKTEINGDVLQQLYCAVESQYASIEI